VAAAAAVALVIWAMPHLPGSLPADNSTPATAASVAPTSTAITTAAPTITATTVTATAATTTARSTLAAVPDGTQRTNRGTTTGHRRPSARPVKTTTQVIGTTVAGTTASDVFTLAYFWVYEGVSYTYDSAQGSLGVYQRDAITLSLPEAQLAEFERLLGLADFIELPEYCCIPPSESGILYRCLYAVYGTQGYVVTCISDETEPPSEQLQRLKEACEYIEEVLMATDAFAQLTAEN
jgi:hypothetical protein